MTSQIHHIKIGMKNFALSPSLLLNAVEPVNIRKLYGNKKYQMSKHFSGVSAKALRDKKFYINKRCKSPLQTYNSATCLFGGASRTHYNTRITYF